MELHTISLLDSVGKVSPGEPYMKEVHSGGT